MADAWLLVEYEPGELGYMDILGEDHYNPVIVCKTREDLVAWLGDEDVTWNGDTATLEKLNWHGEHKYTQVYYALPVTFGKKLIY